MEVVAGEDDTLATVRQHGVLFKLDFRKVYWNSRLEAEHKRLVDTWFQPGQIVVDAMAGVGPFVVPAAKKGCFVLANDLNPDSYAWLVENIKVNKVGGRVKAMNVDGRECLRMACAGGGSDAPLFTSPSVEEGENKQKKKKQKEEKKNGEEQQPLPPTCLVPFDHIVMNLPATAVEFLDALHGSFDPLLWKDHPLPMVHVYAFLKSSETVEDLKKRIETAWGGALATDTKPEFFLVRDVAPNKQMYCASLRVPRHIAFGSCGTDGVVIKKQKVAD